MALELDDVGSGFNLSKINANFQKVADSINDDTMRREVEVGDGNEMRTHLDMNSNEIVNISTDVDNPNSALSVADGDARYVNVTGDSMSGTLDLQGNKILIPDAVGLNEPTTLGQVNQLNALGEDLATVARSLNVLDLDVIHDTDTVTAIPAYIYSASQQKTYAVPADAQGKFISSVVDDLLTTSDLSEYILRTNETEPTVTADSIGIVYNSAPDAAQNFTLLCEYMNETGGAVLIEDDVFMAGVATTMIKGVSLDFAIGKSITWTGTDAFQFDSGTFYKENNATHVNEQIGVVMILTAYSANDNYLEQLISINANYTGNFAHRYGSDLDKDPTVTSGFGLGLVEFDNLKLNGNLADNFFFANSLPYNLIRVTNPTYTNCCRVIFSLPIQNFHPFFYKIQEVQRVVDYTGMNWTNDEDFWADDSVETLSFYVTPLLWEGNILIWRDNNITEVKSRVSDTTIAPCYFGGIHASGGNCHTRNMYGFGPTKINTGLHLKKVLGCNLSGIYHEFDHDFFGRVLADFGETTAGTFGDWITYSPENPDGGGTIIVDDYHCELPTLAPNGTLTAPLLQRWAITNSVFMSEGTGFFNLIRISWTEDNKLDNRYAKFTGNRVHAPNCSISRLMYVGISDERANNKGCSIDNHSNDINCGSVRELHLDAGAATDKSLVLLEHLTINNSVNTVAAHDMFTPGNASPKVKDMTIGGKFTANDRTESHMFVGQNCFNDGVDNGSFQITLGSSPDIYITLLNNGFPSNNYIPEKTFVYSGKIITDNGVDTFDLTIGYQNILPGSIDIAYTTSGGSPGVATWSGSGGSVVAKVNTTHPTLQGRIVRGSADLRILLVIDQDSPDTTAAQFVFDVFEY